MNGFTIIIVANFSKVNLLWCLDNKQHYTWTGQSTDAVCRVTHDMQPAHPLCGLANCKVTSLFYVEVLSNPATTILSVSPLNHL